MSALCTRRFVVFSASVTLGCLTPDAPDRPAPVELVDIDPRASVSAEQPVSLVFSAPLAPLEGCPIRVERPDTRPVAVECALDSAATRLELVPRDGWPPGERLTVVGLVALADAVGRPIGAAEATFDTAPAASTREVLVESPEPGRAAPVNLRRVVVALRGQDLRASSVELRAGDQCVDAVVVASDERGRVLALVPTGGLAPATTYAVSVPGATAGPPTAQSFVRTGTVVDRAAPELRLRAVDRGGSRLRVSVEASEAIYVEAIARGSDGERVPLVAPLLPSSRVELEATRQLSPDTRYHLELRGEDLAGNPGASLEVDVVMPAAVTVRLTELVPSPLHDWNDAATGVPLDAVPGDGPVTDSDEWLELVNTSPKPIDLTQASVRLRVIDATPSEHDLLAAPQLRFGRGGTATAWGIGEALVVRPRGAMSQRGTRVEVVWGDVVLDAVTLDRDPVADHAGGAPPDLDHESIARDPTGAWRWCTPTPGDPWPGECVR